MSDDAHYSFTSSTPLQTHTHTRTHKNRPMKGDAHLCLPVDTLQFHPFTNTHTETHTQARTYTPYLITSTCVEAEASKTGPANTLHTIGHVLIKYSSSLYHTPTLCVWRSLQ